METKHYLLKNVRNELWPRFKAKAALEQRTIRGIFLEAIEKYVNGFQETNEKRNDDGKTN